MVIQDHTGRWWAKATSTDEWYYYDGDDWVLGGPPDPRTLTPDLQSTREQRNRRKQKEVLGAVAVVFAGLTWAAFSFVRWVLPATFLFEPPSLYIQEGAMLLELAGTLVGLMGLYFRRAAGYRGLGTTGFLVASMGATYLLVVTENLLLTGDTPPWMISPLIVWLAQLARSFGFVLLGIAFLRAGVLPRWFGLAFFTGGIVVTISSLSPSYLPSLVDPLFLLVFWPVWLALGYTLWPKRGEAYYLPIRTG